MEKNLPQTSWGPLPLRLEGVQRKAGPGMYWDAIGHDSGE